MFWLFRVIAKDAQIVRAASRRARASDQSAGPNAWAACRPPRTEATKDPSSASPGAMTTSWVPTRTVWVVIVEFSAAMWSRFDRRQQSWEGTPVQPKLEHGHTQTAT